MTTVYRMGRKMTLCNLLFFFRMLFITNWVCCIPVKRIITLNPLWK